MVTLSAAQMCYNNAKEQLTDLQAGTSEGSPVFNSFSYIFLKSQMICDNNFELQGGKNNFKSNCKLFYCQFIDP